MPWKEDMGISKIGSLFASNIDSAHGSSPTKPAESSKQQQARQSVSSLGTDAVVFSRSVTARPPDPVASEGTRATRVQSLKKEVDSGTYRRDSEKVAVAVLKELS